MYYRFIIILLLAVLPFFVSAFEYQVFTQNGKQGLKDNNGIVIIPANFEALGWSYSISEVRNNRIGFLQDGKWGIVSIKNEILFPASLEAVFDATANVIISGKKTINGRFKKGVIDYNGKLIIPYEFNFIKVYDDRLLALQDDKYGVLSLNGKKIIPFSYSSIKYVNNMRWFAVGNGAYGALFNNQGEKLTGDIFHDIEPFENNIAVAHVDHFEGLINKEGQWILEPVFKKIEVADKKASGIPYTDLKLHQGRNDPAVLWSVDSINIHAANLYQLYASGKTWLVDGNNKIIYPKAEKINYHSDQLVVSREDQTGLYNLSSKEWILSPVYEDIIVVNDNLLLTKTKRSDEYLIIHNKKAEPLYRGIQEYRIATEGLYFKKNNSWGFISQAGKEILAPVYEKILDHKDGHFIVTFHRDEGILDSNEEWKVVPQQNKIIDFNSEVYITFDGRLYNMLNFRGERLYFSPYKLKLGNGYIIEERGERNFVRIGFNGLSIKSAFKRANYEEVIPLSEGLIGIIHHGQYGFVDPEGRLRISNRYEGIQSFKNGFASIKLSGKWGVINKREQLVIQPSYDSIGFFEGDNAVAEKNGYYGIISSSGDVVLSLEYDSIVSLNDKYYLLYKNNQTGIAEKSGRAIIWPKYDSITFNNRSFIVEKDHLYGLHDINGVVVLPPVYDIVIPLPGTDNFIIGEKGKNVVVPVN